MCLQTICIYGRKPFMNHPIVGELALVAVLVYMQLCIAGVS